MPDPKAGGAAVSLPVPGMQFVFVGTVMGTRSSESKKHPGQLDRYVQLMGMGFQQDLVCSPLITPEAFDRLRPGVSGRFFAEVRRFKDQVYPGGLMEAALDGDKRP